MADVVRSGAIFRVRDAAALQSPNLRTSSSSLHKAAAPMRVRRVTVSALEVASSVDSSQSQATSAGRRRKGNSAALLPETPVGMPKRKARLQQTPNVRSAKKAGVRATIERTPEEIEANFNQLVMETTMRKESNARRASNNNSVTTRRTRSQSVSSVSSIASPVEKIESTPRFTRSATKARGLGLAPAASPASSVQTQMLESTEEEDEEPDVDDKTPPTKRKTQAKRQRAADEPPSTSVRSSKRLRAQQRLLSSLPPARSPLAQMGNTAEDEELLQIQKRLVFGKNRKTKVPAKHSADDNSTAEEDDSDGGGNESAERVRIPRSSPRRRSDQKQRLSASFSILEDVEALPISKKNQRSSSSNVQKQESNVSNIAVSKTSASKSSAPVEIVLCDWAPQWPPVYAWVRDSSGGQKNQIQLVFEGQVDGRDATFQFARRVSATQFVSTANEHVTLDGCLAVKEAEANGIPEAVMEILDEGLPASWRRVLGTFLHGKKTPKRCGALAVLCVVKL